jgi:16S rRNA (guanine527-N7)-methyltransferase
MTLPPATLQQVQEALEQAGIAGLPARALDQFLEYLGLLSRWNARLNLTSIHEPEEMIRRHVVECVFAAQHLPADVATLLDYGSGAGLPGIPIAICRPEIRVTLAESQGKKASFLREAVRVAGLGSEVYGERVETMPPLRKFDAVCMRAVEKMEFAIPIAIDHVERYLVLLTTERSGSVYRELSPRVEWWAPIPLPNSERRVMAVGRRVD